MRKNKTLEKCGWFLLIVGFLILATTICITVFKANFIVGICVLAISILFAGLFLLLLSCAE